MPGAHHARRLAPRSHPFWRLAYPGLVAVAGLSVLVLVLTGGRAVLTTRVDPIEEGIVLASDEPGYVELVEATPTLLTLHTHDGALTGVAFVALTGFDAGGGVLLLPADLVVAPAGGSADQIEPSSDTLADTFARGGAEAVRHVAEGMFGLGFGRVVELPTESLAHSIGSAAPLPYLLADDLVGTGADGARRVVYRAGRHDLTAADAAAVYAHRNPDESDGNRVQRQRAIWESWLGVVGRAPHREAATPAVESPLWSFLRVLGAGTAVVQVVPFESVASDPSAAPVLVLDADGRAWLRSEALELAPWPRQPESFLRPRVRLLDGAGDPAIRDGVAGEVIAAGGVITVIGNAAAFGVEATHFAYHREELVRDPITNSIAIELGVDMAHVELVESGADVVDITVTVGLDRATR